MSITGGCQCGAVRFRAESLGRASICHCRMCQKAFGGFFGPLVTAHDIVWTRGRPAHFASSAQVRRGFCAACGTPLTFENANGIDVAIGALDDPELAPPTMSIGEAAKLSYTDALPHLPGRPAAEMAAAETREAAIVSNQHPDHDTRTWPPAEGTHA